MNPKIKLAQLETERVDLLAKADAGTITAEEAERAVAVAAEIADCKSAIEKQDEALKALRAAGLGTPTTTKSEEASAAADTSRVAHGGIGDRFVKSEAFRAFRKATGDLPVTGKPVNIEAKNLGPLLVTKAVDENTLGTGDLEGSVVPQRLPGITDLTYRKQPTLLDFITRGTTAASHVQYRQLVSITNNADVVPEKGKKPLSTLETALADAFAHVIADGIKVTNQELADDGIIAALLNSVLTRNIWLKIEDLVLNGTGSGEPRGILNTSGVLQGEFQGDIVSTIRRSITVLQETSDTDTDVVLLNPYDAEALDLLQDDSGRYYGNGPFGSGPGTIWGRSRATSSKIPQGKAVMGDLRSVHLLEREGLSITAFNQNEDDARHNLTYIRAEVRDLLLIREPARILVADLAEVVEGDGGAGGGE